MDPGIGITKDPVLPVCLLCGESFFNRSSLTRHHARRHLKDAFQSPFPCPECLRSNREDGPLIENTNDWSNHVEIYHGRPSAPKPIKSRMIWHYSAVVGETAYCMLCGKDGLHAANGFGRHIAAHKKQGLFDKPISCRGCSQILDAGHEAWMEHMWKVHEAWPTNGAMLHKVGVPSPVLVQSRKRALVEFKHGDKVSDDGSDSDSDALSEWSDTKIDSLLSSLEPCEDPEQPEEPHAQRTPRRKRVRLELETKRAGTNFVKSRPRSPSPLKYYLRTCEHGDPSRPSPMGDLLKAVGDGKRAECLRR